MNNLLYARLAKNKFEQKPSEYSSVSAVMHRHGGDVFIMDTLAQGSGFDSMIGKERS